MKHYFRLTKNGLQVWIKSHLDDPWHEFKLPKSWHQYFSRHLTQFFHARLNKRIASWRLGFVTVFQKIHLDLSGAYIDFLEPLKKRKDVFVLQCEPRKYCYVYWGIRGLLSTANFYYLRKILETAACVLRELLLLPMNLSHCKNSVEDKV